MKNWLFPAAICLFGIQAVACSVEVPNEEELGSSTEELSCSNPGGLNGVAAALAVTVAKELGRWNSTADLMPNGPIYDYRTMLVLTPTGKARCADGQCWNTQAILDLQKDAANGTLINGTASNSISLRTNLVQFWERQRTCDSRPDNHAADNCPADPHQLTLTSSAPGTCDLDFWFTAKSPDGSTYTEPAQLKNKLIFAGYPNNPYLNFRSLGELVGVDPTGGLTEGGSTSSGSCEALCTKSSATDITGQCCSCNSKTYTFKRSAFNPNMYQCKL